MSKAKDHMEKALKDVVVLRLRALDFTGSFPHFRRRMSNRFDLLTFQFDRHGGGFVIEIGQSPLDGFITPWGKKIPPEKVRAWDLPPNQRARLQPQDGSGTESWFRFETAATQEDFNRTAEKVLPFLAEAEKMFEDFEKAPKIR